jgi:P-type Cu2+ transporter
MTPVAARRAPATAAACSHCGQPVPLALVRQAEAEQFCCTGCRQVYTLVREWGFDQYYRLVGQQQGALEPATVTGRSFDDFDDARVQAPATEELGGERRRTRLYLEGVHCAACVWLVEKLPAVLAGVDEVRLNYGSAVAEVTWRPAHTRLSTIGRALDRLGYTPHVHQAARLQDARRAEDRAGLARLGVATACAMNLMFVSGALYAGEYSGMASPYEAFFRWLSLVVALPVIFFSAKPFFQTAIAGLRAGIVHIDLPIAIALAVASAASAWNTVTGAGPLWFDSLAMLVAALLGARQLQRSAQRAALERADSLRGVAFLEFARRVDGHGADATVLEVPLSALVPGDVVEVRSGELVPVDGVVLSGRSALDNAVLTGETAPLAVGDGDAVNAGATNLGARLLVRVNATGAQTRVGALLAIVQDALSRKPSLLQTTDALARRFVQVLLVVALATVGIGWAQFGPEVAMTRVVALLVVSCPCALGLAVPLAMSVPRASPARLDGAARQDRHPHRGARHRGALAGRGRGAPVRPRARSGIVASGRPRLPGRPGTRPLRRARRARGGRDSGPGHLGPGRRPRRARGHGAPCRCRPRAGVVRHRLLRDGRRGPQSSLRRGGRTSRRCGRHRR